MKEAVVLEVVVMEKTKHALEDELKAYKES